MKILLVVTGLPDQGNPARSVFNLNFARGLRKEGVEVQILYLRSLHYKRNIITENNIDGIKCLEVGFSIPEIKMLKSTIFLKTLFSVFQSQIEMKLDGPFDAIHAVGGGAVLPAYTFSSFTNTPLIVQFIGSDINLHLNKYLKDKTFLKGIHSAKVLCFNSGALKTEFENSYSLPKQMEVIYRGIDLKKYNYVDKNFDSRLNVLFLGGFPCGNSNLKGGQTLLKMLKMLDREDLEKEILFRMAGPNSDQQIINQFSNDKLTVEFLGAITAEEVQKELQNSHMVIIPSIAEGVPNVLYESMATGNCIIASEIGGIPEIITSGQDALLVPSNNPDFLLKSFLSVYNKPKTLRHLSLEARSTINRLDYNLFLTKYINIYRQLSNKAFINEYKS